MKMTKTLMTLMLLTSLCFSSLISAEEVVVPVIAKPSVLQEGTQRELSLEQIKELIPWAKNSKVFLNDLLDGLQGLGSEDKLDRLETGIKSIVTESEQKNSELLIRYVLNRGLVINDILKAETSALEVGIIDTKIRVLISSVKMAISYYDEDMNTLTKKQSISFIAFGVNYFNFLTDLNKSIFDASANFNIQRTSLEWLQWDLYRDLNNNQVASQILKINNTLKIIPTNKMSDAKYISNVKQMKLVISQLKMDQVLADIKKNVRDQEQKILSEKEKEKQAESAKRRIAEFNSSESKQKCAETNRNYQSACVQVTNEYYLSAQEVRACTVFSNDDYAVICMQRIGESRKREEAVSFIARCGIRYYVQSEFFMCIQFM